MPFGFYLDSSWIQEMKNYQYIMWTLIVQKPDYQLGNCPRPIDFKTETAVSSIDNATSICLYYWILSPPIYINCLTSTQKPKKCCPGSPTHVCVSPKLKDKTCSCRGNVAFFGPYG